MCRLQSVFQHQPAGRGQGRADPGTLLQFRVLALVRTTAAGEGCGEQGPFLCHVVEVGTEIESLVNNAGNQDSNPYLQ